MKVGNGLMFQNSVEFHARSAGVATPLEAGQFFRDEMITGALAVEAGFDGVWFVEHHGTSHAESPDPVQQLTFFAGRTPDADLGTFVAVLPWHDPIRLAEQIAVLDNLMKSGQQLTLGVGRGSAEAEFEYFEQGLSESTERFRENWEIIRRLLTEENVSYQGKFRSVKNMTLLPRPKTPNLPDRAYYAWGSKASLLYAAEAGFKPLFIPKGSVEEMAAQMKEYDAIRESTGQEPVRPVVTVVIYCDEDAEAASTQGKAFIREFFETTLTHYNTLDAEHFRKAGNYPEYVQAAEAAAGIPRDDLLDSLVEVQIAGTPTECIEKLRNWHEVMNPEEFIFVMRYGGMTLEESERNIRTLAEKVLPVVKSWAPKPVAQGALAG